MPTIKLNVDNDIAIEKNKLVLIDGQNYIIQMLTTRLKTFFGEIFTDRTKGIPYFEEIFTKGINLNRVESIFKKEILETKGIINLLEFEMSFNKELRKLNIYFVCKVESGIIRDTIELP